MSLSHLPDSKESVSSKDSRQERVERIYIGGLHPPHLTVRDLQIRLQDSLGSVIDILLSNKRTTTTLDEDTACYLHLNARTKKPDDPKSAQEYIAKMYHNVIWKGCKLKVEAARPHFLERLNLEIQERREQPKREELWTEEPGVLQPKVCTRRHLKIRESFGEEVFAVDTKPYHVQSWKGMTGLLQKIDRRRRHFREKLLEERGKTNAAAVQVAHLNMRRHSKLNRAVHLRFSGAGDPPANSAGRDVSGHSDADSVSSSADEVTADSSSSGEDSSSTENNLRHGDQPKSAYVWSDSDSSESSSDDSDSDGTHEQSQSSENKSDRTDSEKRENQLVNVQRHNQEGSDGSDSPEIDHGDTKQQTKFHRLPSELDEFEAAIGTDNFSDSSEDSHRLDDSELLDDESNEDGSLLKEVEANLSVLASIFPEIKSDSTDSEKSDNQLVNVQGHNQEGSDGSDSPEIDHGDTKQQTKPHRLPSELDEFEAAMGTENFSDNSEDSHRLDDSELLDDESHEDGSLLKEVEANLSVLASIFPDMKKLRPQKVATEEDQETAAELLRKSGWSKGGVMLRYDPRKDDTPASSKEPKSSKLASSGRDHASLEAGGDRPDDHPDKSGPRKEPETPSGVETSKDDEKDDIEHQDSNEQQKNEANDLMPTTSEPVGDNIIYKQEKLEEVFREAREASHAIAPALVQGSPQTGAFAFDFNLGSASAAEPTNQAKLSDGFTFSFFPPSTNDKDQQINSKAEVGAEDSKKDSPSPMADATKTKDSNIVAPKTRTFRRKGPLFPKDVLDQYQEDFYVMNDGLKILRDLERYRLDEEVKAHWTQERQVLTKDWKRKRKHAAQAGNKQHKGNMNRHHQ